METQSQPRTLADDLREALAEFDDNLDGTSASVGYIFDLLDDPRATRLAACRIGRCNLDRGAYLDWLHTLRWLLDEGVEQAEALPGALAMLLEPPRSNRTRYGRKTGIFVNAPLDWTRCGTPANYRAHLRRGQDACQACRKAIARYNAVHPGRRKSVPHTIIQLGESSCP
jgi:hypothetical protein